MEPKTPIESRTVLVNIVWIILSLAGLIPEMAAFIQQFLQDNPIQWEDLSQVVAWGLMVAKGLMDIWLRSITKTALSWKK